MNRADETSPSGSPAHRYAQARQEGRCAVGVICCMDGYATSHLLAGRGFDFVMIDREHGAYTWPQLENLGWRIRNTGAAMFVRTATADSAELNLTVDLPVDGVMIPHIDSLETARRAIASVLFPPRGERSIGNVRNSTLQGYDFRELPPSEPLVGLLIEHIGAVDAIDEIIDLPGVDMLFVGPHDLAVSMGIDPQTEKNRPVVLQEAIDKVKDAAKRAGIDYWVWGPTMPHAFAERDSGADAVMWSMDATILADAADAFLQGWHAGSENVPSGTAPGSQG